jgi:hypothetical protein
LLASGPPRDELAELLAEWASRDSSLAVLRRIRHRLIVLVAIVALLAGFAAAQHGSSIRNYCILSLP